jgi:DNA-binding NtrC family response regulator
MAERRYRLLVVDDLIDWQKTLGGLLSEAGYEVQMVGSIVDARDKLVTTNFDLAVLDVRLDETDENNTDGLDLAEEIKRRWPKTKVVIATGYGTPPVVRRAMEPQAGTMNRLADDFISKADTNKLVEVVRGTLTHK